MSDNTIFSPRAMDDVIIVGCPLGIDWSVIHEGNNVKIITEAGKETIVSIKDYTEEVNNFADKIEKFYKTSTPRCLDSHDEYDIEGYRAFWNE